MHKYEIITGIEEEALKNNLNVIYFLGHELQETSFFEKYQDAIRMLFSKECIDYLVFLPGLVDIVPQSIQNAFLNKAFPVPALTISFQINDYPAIIVDNKEGFRNMIKHLIEKHGKRRFAFIKGNDYNYDARERFAVFREVLAESGLPLLPELLFDGIFVLESGKDAISAFIDKYGLQPGKDFDAVIAANDLMAIGALRELIMRNVNVPDVVAVCGFDDIESAQYQDVPLTTVRLPNKELGSAAVKYIVNNPGQVDLITIPTHLVIRNSCGCSSMAIKVSDAAIPGQDQDNYSATRQNLIHCLEQLVADYLPAAIGCKLAGKLVDAFFVLWKEHNGKTFLEVLRSTLMEYIEYSHEVNLWNNALILFTDWLLKAKPAEPLGSIIRNTLDEGFIEITNFIIKENTKETIDLDLYTEKLRDAGESIKITQDFDQFINIISESLTRLDFRSFYLFQYQEPGVFDRSFKNILAFSDKRRVTIDNNNSIYNDFYGIYTRLLKREQPVAYCVSPIFYNNLLFGFVIINKTSHRFERLVYDELTSQISNALKGSRLLIETQDASRELATINFNLKQTEKELQQELSAASRLQTCLIPASLEIPGLELAAQMRIAHPAGGDYYDVVPAGGKDWIFIGDIAGHGVYTNLVMMMVQTSIHITLRQQPGITPYHLVTLVNEVVTGNTRKLGDYEFMKLAVFIHHADGLFSFTGYHHPLLIYRSRQGLVECAGGAAAAPPGIQEDMAFTLEEEDCLLLYTDGIIKARQKMNADIVYGTERLSGVLEHHGKYSARSIIAAVMDDLDAFSCRDDITLLAIKKGFAQKAHGGQQ